MRNRKLIENLTKHINESMYGKAEVVLRTLIAEEQTAAAHYMKAAHKMLEKAEDKGDKNLLKIAKILEDIANEEKVHIGELQECLKLLNISDKEIIDGEAEAREKMEK